MKFLSSYQKIKKNQERTGCVDKGQTQALLNSAPPG